MRHRVAGRKLGRTTSHRMAMLRNLVTSFFDRERIQTTLAKAKEARPLAEKIITLAKRDDLHSRRQVLRFISRKDIVTKLFDTLAPRFSTRQGGYTRILRVGPRPGDGAEMAVLELIGSEWLVEKEEKKKLEKAKEKSKRLKKARPAIPKVSPYVKEKPKAKKEPRAKEKKPPAEKKAKAKKKTEPKKPKSPPTRGKKK